MNRSVWSVAALTAAGASWYCCSVPDRPAAPTPAASAALTEPPPATAAPAAPATPTALDPFVQKAVSWLVEAQLADGAWGGGSHAQQQIRDAHAVPGDPATTAVAAMALMRTGHTILRGDHREVVRRAAEWLLTTVEHSPDGPQITELAGTQPQAKMGQNVDTALAAQFFARLLRDLPADAALRPRVERALDQCTRKIESAQTTDGSWAAGGWAPVLQSAQMCTALELSQLAGRTIDEGKLTAAREYQKGLATAGAPGAAAPTAGSGTDFTLITAGAAGVELYSSASNARAVAAEARAAEQLVAAAKSNGTLAEDARTDAATLRQLGIYAARASTLALAVQQNAAAKVRAFDEQVLDGFGNNGGEEYLSYQMKSESLAIDGGAEWSKWTTQMRERLAKVQNEDGSWSGHHCITSPVFCTATAISCLCADRDVDWLRQVATLARK